ncbi:alpha/beta fold hydrolase [Nocardia mangyaensis]|uniref:alpha/beta fold hydrolase n=1 Tax=Nocardia mangyaensis TaxID=2213200 RepID=UPI0026759035|nr:alpha/beta fold hydrolase [Nocardia mangyaensis]MDO3646897.1 alpha/beta fold hydrolase [Nocardia mangyaensis]
MTSAGSDLVRLSHEMPISSHVVDVDGVPMSALLAEAADPRAVIVAIHGGVTTSAYFDCPGHPRLSLLRTAPALGFTVLAIDRPGYGSSAPYAADIAPAARRVDLAYALVERVLGARPRGAGTFVLAHSAGCELAVRMAADERGAQLLGIELAGTGREHHPEAIRSLTAGGPGRGDRLRELLWQPSRLYPAEVFGGAAIASPGPAYEATMMPRWVAHDFARAAANVRVPVQFTVGAHEKVWRTDPRALGEITALFTAAPRVVVNEQADAGHNLSMGHSAAAYHLRVMSFIEECVIARR